MLVQLKYKNTVISGYFISDEGKIYDENRVEQELKIYPSKSYFYFKKHKVHQMMCHSFFGYKEGFDVHHKNEIKTDNRLENLCYLTREEHRSLHMIGNKNLLGKKLSDKQKSKLSVAAHRKQVYCVQLNKVFDGVRIAGKELSLYYDSISKCCKGKLKTTGGYHFEYYEGDLI